MKSHKAPFGLTSGAAEILRQQANLSEEEYSYVQLSPEWCAELLDPAGWTAVLDTFAHTMRLAVALSDREGRLLGNCHNPQPVWSLAQSGRANPDDAACPFCLLAAGQRCGTVEEALKTHGVAMAQDQAGLTHVAVPLSLGGQQLGTLIAGQVFCRHPEPLPLQRVARDWQVSPQGLWAEAIHQAPIARSTLQMYANLLMALGQAFLGQRYAAILQRRLAQTSQRYRLFFDGVKDYALLTVDPTGRITSWNSGAERLFGYREGEMMGQDASRLSAADDVPAEGLQRPMSEADTSGWVEWEGWRVRNDGTRFLGTCVLASLGRGETREYGVLIRDVTELRRSAQELQQAQKMEGIGVLAGGIAHDFNNLLTGVMGSLTLVKDRLSPGDSSYPIIEIAERSSIRAAELVAQLLAYAGKGKFVISRFDLSVLISEMLPLIAASIPKAVHLELALKPDLPWIEADASQIRQIVMNLIINGAEAIGAEGGTVRVATGLVGEGSDIFMEVKDSGSGMSETTKAQIFDPFFSTKFTGRGLGLASVSGIVRSHKGALQVDSMPGKGTTFTVSFPAVPAGVLKPAGMPVSKVPRSTGTILVADDEPSLTQLAEVILKQSGYSVLVAANGREAVDIFRQNAAGIAAVLLDVTMPVMGGHAAFALIREIQPGVPIILSSGYNETYAREELGSDAAAGFIQKPYSASQLVKGIQEAIQRGGAG
ncbi:ATP-binding protein [uncultured Paludibaculum sp.]|uniref:ATP-binding protein n=1 Tax=uncultured Paludibaculum sp. TaxID=1765020 RepID=UPI002AAADAA3|nr:ATP-binding protein [uncultured Paludibaculum sp.]